VLSEESPPAAAVAHLVAGDGVVLVNGLPHGGKDRDASAAALCAARDAGAPYLHVSVERHGHELWVWTDAGRQVRGTP